MLITLCPMRRDDRLTLSRSGETLTVNGIPLDLAALPEGGAIPRDAVDCAWLVSDITRTDGEIALTLILPHGADAPHETLFPAPVRVVGDGPVALPPQHGEDAQ